MLALVAIAFVAGVVTAISPCVLPVLPIVLAGGATGRRPLAIGLGLVASFTTFTLAGAALLSALGLPDDVLRDVAIAVVIAVGLSLLVPRLGDLLARPFRPLARSSRTEGRAGFLLGVSLGLLFTPCAGPVIAAVATLAASGDGSLEAVAVTLAYALGAGVVLVGAALAARRGIALAALRARAPAIRRALGAAVVGVAVLMVFGLDLRLQTKVPGYTRALQGLEESASAQSALDRLLGRTGRKIAAGELDDYGPAPELAGTSPWLNSRPLTLRALRGKVVVLDFWTYSCINCLRTLPYLERWYETYRDAGLVVLGIHTPEFAFEREADNVRKAVRSLGLRYPVALDNDYATWNAWGNRYWPAKYFIDRRGHVRFAHFGEGAYEESEGVIRALLAEPGLPPPVSSSVRGVTARGVETPETYLGWLRLNALSGSALVKNREASYAFPETLPANAVALSGRWTVERERIVAGRDARLRLNFHAGKVFLVLGTAGIAESVRIFLDGRELPSVRVTRDRLYTLVDGRTPARRLLELRISPGTQAYAFTFG